MPQAPAAGAKLIAPLIPQIHMALIVICTTVIAGLLFTHHLPQLFQGAASLPGFAQIVAPDCYMIKNQFGIN